ncbi:MAG TPA: bifunctional serine/threonine-protein kinase/formylglycine-generating enzyme family protein, partial [Planctomycetota bacterium]
MEYVEGVDLAAITGALASDSDLSHAVSTAFESIQKQQKDLFEHLEDVSKPPPDPRFAGSRYRQLARLFRDAALGLHDLHERGIVHRDVKPGNIMVTHPEQRAVIMDLGLAAVSNATASLTGSRDHILGTLRYMAPEQLQRSLVSVDRRADVYALGATLYELMTDHSFFDGETTARLVEQVLRESPVAVRKAASAVPSDVAMIVAKATQKDPRLRYQTAEEMARDLDAFLKNRPIAARAPALGYVLSLAIRRNQALTATLATAVLVIAVLTVVFLIRKRDLLDMMSAPVLVDQEAELFPVNEDLVPVAQAWLARVRALLGRWDGPADEAEPTAPTSLGDLDRQRFFSKLHRLRELEPIVQDRVKLARDLRQLSLVEHTAAWEAAIAAIADPESKYGGLQIEPQPGLVPLRLDPESGLYEFWHLSSGERPLFDPAANRYRLTDDSGIVLVLIPGDPGFSIRDETGTSLTEDEKKLSYRKNLEPFFLSKFETTQGQWIRWMETNPSEVRALPGSAVDGRHPVENLTWFQATSYCQRLGLRLPTEAQWEFAARAG